MESLPAETLATAATAALAAPVAGDAVADAVDPAELLGIDVDQSAGLLPLVADDCHGRVESLEPAEPDPAQRLADRRDRPAEAARDRRPRQPLAPQDCDLGFGGGIKPERAGMRPRRAVAQAGSTFHPEAVAPLAHRPAVDTERRRHGRDRRARLKTFHDQHSTARRGSGILMNVHPRLLGDGRVCGNRNLASKPRTDNLHSNDS